MKSLLAYFRSYRDRKLVRPWALAVPLLVLLVCLPILRPIRHPDPRQMGDDESARYATVQALVEDCSLVINRTSFISTQHKVQVGKAWYAQQPPLMAVMLSAAYEVLYRMGVTFKSNPSFVMYLLTVLGTTLPVAAASGLVYRMARLFELTRFWRMMIAFGVTFGSGWVSYATVLNPHAPSAALVLTSAACLIHVSILNRPLRSGGWLALSGFCVALASVIDVGAALFLCLFAAVIPTMRWRWSLRIGGVLMYVIGAIAPLALHVSLTLPTVGEWRPVLMAREGIIEPAQMDSEEEELPPRSTWTRITSGLNECASALIGSHGIFNHFPILLVALAGMGMLMHRHWPASTKMLALASLGGLIGVILLYVFTGADWHWQSFAARSFVVFMPMCLFWTGVWLRKPHAPWAWMIAGILLGFSTLTTLLGATNPTPVEGYRRYSVVGACLELIHPRAINPTEIRTVLGR